MADVIDNKDARRYELVVDGLTVYADYRREGVDVWINYVFSPPELRGSGAAGRLMQGIMDIAQRESLKITPICSYAVSWMWRYSGII